MCNYEAFWNRRQPIPVSRPKTMSGGHDSGPLQFTCWQQRFDHLSADPVLIAGRKAGYNVLVDGDIGGFTEAVPTVMLRGTVPWAVLRVRRHLCGGKDAGKCQSLGLASATG